MAEINLHLLNRDELQRAQEAIIMGHYLHKPVNQRCSPVAYAITLNHNLCIGYLIFGRPQAARVKGWYGNLKDVLSGKCQVTQWQVLNLARVWLSPTVQAGGTLCTPGTVPRLP